LPYFPSLTVAGQEIAFDHLEPFSLVVPTATKAAGVRIDVVFSNHCFSETFAAQVHLGGEVDVWDRDKRRVFDQVRYNLSKALPGIIQGLPTSAVFLTPEANFVRITMPGGMAGADYRMFFRIIKADKGSGCDLRLRVESAYSPTIGQAVPAHDMTKIRFVVLVDKTLRGEKVRRQYKR
jgi:hypothetical protein